MVRCSHKASAGYIIAWYLTALKLVGQFLSFSAVTVVVRLRSIARFKFRFTESHLTSLFKVHSSKLSLQACIYAIRCV